MFRETPLKQVAIPHDAEQGLTPFSRRSTLWVPGRPAQGWKKSTIKVTDAVVRCRVTETRLQESLIIPGQQTPLLPLPLILPDGLKQGTA